MSGFWFNSILRGHFQFPWKMEWWQRISILDFFRNCSISCNDAVVTASPALADAVVDSCCVMACQLGSQAEAAQRVLPAAGAVDIAMPLQPQFDAIDARFDILASEMSTLRTAYANAFSNRLDDPIQKVLPCKSVVYRLQNHHPNCNFIPRPSLLQLQRLSEI